MGYDKNSFLAGVAAGRNMESWPAFRLTENGALKLKLKIDSNHSGAYPNHYGFIGITSGSSFMTSPHTPPWPGSPEVTSFLVFWGDGTYQEYNVEGYVFGIEHYYLEDGEYEVIIFGLPSGTEISNNAWQAWEQLTELYSLPGPLQLGGNYNAFQNLRIISGDIFRWFGENRNQYAWDTAKFRNLFKGFSSLKFVPGNIFNDIRFDGNDFYLDDFFLDCTSLEAVGPGLFDNTEFKRVTSAKQVFKNCSALTGIPNELFKQLESVTDFTECFSNSGIETIPEKTFENCATATKLYRSFYNCKSLTGVSEDVFRGLDSATDFRQCFAFSGIRSVNGNIFRHTPSASMFQLCFAGCEDLISVPDNIFDGADIPDPASVNTFNNTFLGCESLRHCPPLWERYTTPRRNYCFSGCVNADNYSSVPALWK